MHSTVFTAVCLVICSCLRPTIYAEENNRPVRNEKDCSLRVADTKLPKMPIPYTIYGEQYAIIYPNAEGRLVVKNGYSFHLSCTSAKFASRELQERCTTSNALVTCVGGDDVLEYCGRTYRYDDFQCNKEPSSQLKVTGGRCQKDKYTVAVVGFQTDRAFLRLYGVCFDKSTMNSLYTWYEARVPYYDNHQTYGNNPSFKKSVELYGEPSVDIKYNPKEQKKTVATILRSQGLADKYIREDQRIFLSRGHYAARADFYFNYEQISTYYYANVAPQWQIFNGGIWARLEQFIRSELSEKSGTSRHVIVTGTHDTCTLADVDNVQQPLYLGPYNTIRVPLFYWKLVYDVDKEDGIVYIGLNNPYKKIDKSVYICPNICPGGYNTIEMGPDGIKRNDIVPDTNGGLIYCCTKEEFEDRYAPQWQIFNGDMWADLEQSTRSKLSKESGTSRHVIVTGTYDTCTLADVDGVQQPLYLDLPGAIRVPLFYWKLNYDVDAADGIVYIGLNNPYKEIDDSVYICPNICPDGYHGRGYQGRGNTEETGPDRGHRNDPEPDANDGLIYCCTKKSFEEAYGELDPIVYRQLM